MIAAIWFVIVGSLLVLIALLGATIERWPISTGLIYLVIGFGLGPAGVDLLRLDWRQHAQLLEHVFEIVVLISLFTVGLKLRAPLPRGAWSLTLRLAVGAMALTVAALTLVIHFAFDLNWPYALLLAAILAPTDPVLASDVQTQNSDDRDRVRFGLTAEGGVNDISAFPIVFLALGLLGLHEIGPWGARWLTVDVLWGALSAAAIGWASGRLVGRLALRVGGNPDAPLGLEEFLTLGVIALSYGLALLAHGLAFVAVFTAGLAMRRSQTEPQALGPFAARTAPESTSSSSNAAEAGLQDSPEERPRNLEAREPTLKPMRMVQEALMINERVERIAEVAAVLLLGGLISAGVFATQGIWLACALMFVIRPLAVTCVLQGTDLSRRQKGLVGWFGIRGVGSLYYLFFAIGLGLTDEDARQLSGLALASVATSIVLHGISATPVMRRYRRWRREEL